MFDDSDILDAPKVAKTQKMFPDARVEKTTYISMFCFQYFLIFISLFSNMIAGFSIVIGCILHAIIHVIIFLSSVIGYFTINPKDQKRLIHLLLSVLCIFLVFVSKSVNAFTMTTLILPHLLGWFYIYILSVQQKEREKLLALQKAEKKLAASKK